MKKIVIIGSTGSGKSTFARKLSRILNIEVFHLDRYFWDSDWKEYPRKKRLEIEHKLISTKHQWIIEGSYFSSSDNRLKVADTIIFLDMPLSLCLWRAITRHIKDRGVERPDLPIGCTDRISPKSILKILLFPFKDGRLLREKLKEIHASKTEFSREKEIIILRSPEEVEDFLLKQRVKAQQEKYGLCTHKSTD